MFFLQKSSKKTSEGVIGLKRKRDEEQKPDKKRKIERDPELYNRETLRAVKRILDISDEIYGHRGEREIDPYWNQTKSGLMLLEHNLLCTPWGQIKLVESGSLLRSLPCQQELMKQLNTTYHYVKPKKYFCIPSLKFYVLISNDINLREDKREFKELFREVAKQDLQKLDGKHILLKSNTITMHYNVNVVNQVKLPKCELLNRDDYREYDAVRRAWEDIYK